MNDMITATELHKIFSLLKPVKKQLLPLNCILLQWLTRESNQQPASRGQGCWVLFAADALHIIGF